MKGGRITYFAYAFVMFGMVLGAFPACQRRPLEDPDFFTKVKVKVNVNAISNVTCDVYNDKLPVQNIEPTAMHVLFYDINDNSVAAESYITNVSSESDGSRSLSGDIAILPGKYKLLVYDFGTESTIVRNYSNFYSAEAYTDPVESYIRSHFQGKAGESGMIVNQPDHLVVASSEEENIPWHNDVYTIFTEAKSVVESWYVQIKVDGAEYISGAQAVLSGMVGSNHIATDSRQNEPQVSVWFELKKSDDKGVPVKHLRSCAGCHEQARHHFRYQDSRWKDSPKDLRYIRFVPFGRRRASSLAADKRDDQDRSACIDGRWSVRSESGGLG